MSDGLLAPSLRDPELGVSTAPSKRLQCVAGGFLDPRGGRGTFDPASLPCFVVEQSPALRGTYFSKLQDKELNV